MATGFGYKPVRHLSGGKLRVRPYVIPSTNGTALYIGDVVQLAGGHDAAAGLPTITQNVAGEVMCGVVVGFQYNAAEPYKQFRAASTRQIVQVCDDPNAVFQVQEDADGGAISAANVGSSLNADNIVAAGSAVTGLSGHMLDSNTAAATAAQFKIVGILRDASNAAAQSGGAILEVVPFEHAYTATDSIT